MHLSRQGLGFASVTRISKVRQCETNRPDILAVDINFWRRVDARVCDFKSQKRGERLRFNRKLEGRIFLRARIKVNCIGRQSSSHSSEVLDILRRRVQRWRYRERLRDKGAVVGV